MPVAQVSREPSCRFDPRAAAVRCLQSAPKPLNSAARCRAPVFVAPMLLLAASAVWGQPASERFRSRELSRFQRAKAVLLLREKLPCLGCHELDGEGGRIGPDLSNVGAVRSPGYLFRIVSNPEAVVPGTAMPRVPMPPGTLELIVNYLAGRTASTAAPAASDARVQRGSPIPDEPRAVYARFCAPCHGASGAGDGPNSEHLPVRPTAHADSVYMSTRPDDALFDAVYSGGLIMGRSNRMPPFGQTLDRETIGALVGLMRELCRCRGPAWSRDGQ